MTRIASRRLLATLSSLPSGSSAPPLAPPYAHTTSPRSPRSLQPPYKHSVSPQVVTSSKISAPYRYSLTRSENTTEVGPDEEVWKSWVEGILGDDIKRKEAVAVWEETLDGLNKARVDGAQIPEIAYTSLSEHLSDSSTAESIKNIGSVVVRDVVPDSMALTWARDIWEAIEQRQGDAVYWHPALLAARSNVSILNTNSSILSAIAGDEGEDAFILAEGVTEGLGTGANSRRTGDIRSAWATDKARSPSTPLLAHLALTPSSPSSAHSLPTSIHTATYSLLRPLFQASRSRISFYSSDAYLSSSNWSLVSDIPNPTADMPHLDDLPTAQIKLNPGDIILRNSALPLDAAQGVQAFLPVSPLPRTLANMAYVKAQRESYEAGLPPPSAGAGKGDGWRVEDTVGKEGLGGWRGKKVMGY